MRVRILTSAVFSAIAVLGMLGAPVAAAAEWGATLAAAPSERAAVVSGAAPVLATVANMTVNAGQTADQTVTATDADGDPITFWKVSGPAYMTVTTTNPGPGAASGNVHLAPGASLPSGSESAAVGASDGSLTAMRTFQITVIGSNDAPVLTQPNNMSLKAGSVADQELTATDANGDPLTFSKDSGPAFVTVTTTDPGAGVAHGNVHVAPGASDGGIYTPTVSVSDGNLSDRATFTINVAANRAPYFTSSVYAMSVRAGMTADQTLYAFDPDNDPVAFSKVWGPAFMTVTTSYAGPGTAYGNIHLAPSASDVGTTTDTVMVSDGALSERRAFTVTVTQADRPPVLVQPADMTVIAGAITTQTISATDPDGNYVSIYKADGPAYMTVSSSGNYGSATATVTLGPGAADVGSAIGSVTAYANSLTDTKSFNITVSAGDFPTPCGPGTFSPVTTSFGQGLIEVQTADLNADDILDVLVEIPGSNRASVALGNGDGTFGPPSDLAAGTGPASGVIADFDRDGRLDIAVLDMGSGYVYVFIGDGAGGFGSSRRFQIGDCRSIVTTDVNRDGKLDLLGASPDYDVVCIMRGNGDGTFQTATTLTAGYAAWHLATPDLNGDGAPDLVVVNTGDGDISVYRNNGSGSFTGRTDYPVGREPYAVTPADLNGDGKIDLAVSNSYSNSVTVYLGNGDGTLGSERTFSTGGEPRQIAAVDLNGDGHLDLATANLEPGNTTVLLGDGTGAFGGYSIVWDGPYQYGIASGDFDDDLRTDIAVTGYYDGVITVLLNHCAPERDHPPVVKAPAGVTGKEGSPITFTVTAHDPDGPPIASLTASLAALPLGNNAAFTTAAGNLGGTFAWTPSYQDSRPATYDIVFTATNVLTGSATTRITVVDENRAPIANAGGPYSAFAGSPLSLDGSGSSDPDGDALTYLWVFGDGKTGTGVSPAHTYAAVGTYGIALTVSDGALSALATTTANIVGIFQARAFTGSGSRSIKLNAGKPLWCVNLEPVGKSYSNLAVDLTSVVMKSEGTGSVGEIHSTGNKTAVGGDSDGNGVEEITACFGKGDLRLLFSNLRGNTTVTVTLEGHLFTGGIFQAQMDVLVAAGGGSLAASIVPNPLNPDAVLTFLTEKTGRVRVDVFDLNGRLVRRLVDEGMLPAGYHDLRISSRDGGRGAMASGVYFFRIETPEGTETGRFTVLK